MKQIIAIAITGAIMTIPTLFVVSKAMKKEQALTKEKSELDWQVLQLKTDLRDLSKDTADQALFQQRQIESAESRAVEAESRAAESEELSNCLSKDKHDMSVQYAAEIEELQEQIAKLETDLKKLQKRRKPTGAVETQEANDNVE